MALSEVGQFKFISSFGRLLQAHDDGEMHASQDPSNVGEEERWNVFVWPNGQISLANYATNLFLSCEDTGRAIANRAQANQWETWMLVSSGDSAHVHQLSAMTPSGSVVSGSGCRGAAHQGGFGL